LAAHRLRNIGVMPVEQNILSGDKKGTDSQNFNTGLAQS